MSEPTPVVLPDVGEGLTEAEILTWHVAPGDTVEVNQIVVEIETAKAAVELPCPHSGVVGELLAEPGATVRVGDSIMTVQAEGERSRPSAPDVGPDDSGQVPNLVGYGPAASRSRRRRHTPAAPPAAEPQPASQTSQASQVPQAKPPVRKLAKDLGVDLHAVTGSGPGGVITRDDVQHAGSPHRDGEHREPARGIRRATARAMTESAFTAPHVTEFLTVDVTAMTRLREQLANRPEFAEHPPTPLAFAAKAVCLALRRSPELNASWDDATEEIVTYDHVHLGIAAATPRGLIVPKLRHAESQTLTELTAALADLTATARAGSTAPEDLTGGTFTITNVGVFGVDTGTPILNPGEAGILALGAIRDMPWVVDGAVVPRAVCQLALSFDHRVVDGQQGSRFLADVGALLAEPGLAMTY